MSFETFHPVHASLPGRPAPFFLSRGEGEAAMVFDDLFTVVASADETNGQFGMFTAAGPPGDPVPTHSHADTHETFFVIDGAVRVWVEDAAGERTTRLLGPGDFGFVPSGCRHAYQIEQAARMVGVTTAGFERFFATLGTPIEAGSDDRVSTRPDESAFRRASEAFRTEFFPDFDWTGAST